MKTARIIIVAAVCALLIAITYFFVPYTIKISIVQRQGGAPGIPGMPGFGGGRGGWGGGQQSVTSVRTQVAEKTALQDYVLTTGEIEAQSSIDVYPEIGGKLTNVYVNLGSKVKKGDLIAKIDPSSPGMQYVLSPVYAPISGSITTLPLQAGTTVTKNSSLTTIGETAALQVKAKVPERYVASLRQGLTAAIVLEAYPSETFTATVTSVSPVVDKTSRSKEILLTFTGNDPRINAGMFAKIRLNTDVYAGQIAVPTDAIIEKSGEKYVYVLNPDGQTVTRRTVSTGKTVDNVTQLLSGVNVGEKIVVEGMRVLGEGSAVKDVSGGIQALGSTQDADGGAFPAKPDGMPDGAALPDGAQMPGGKKGAKGAGAPNSAQGTPSGERPAGGAAQGASQGGRKRQ